MVFSSLPHYLDPPNWQQHLNQNHQQTNGNNEDSQLIQHQHQPPQLVPVQPSNHLTGGGGSGGGNNTTNPATFIRPNSMTERARLAKIPQPDAPLKCPRCESTNTKFCYYNNYSLTQPRHFCKTCRRYWTRGGALRSVPVGGGCRRNKRSKSINSKSNTSSNGNIGNTGTAGTPTSGGGGMMMNDNKYNSSGPVDSLSGHLSATPQLSFMASLQNMTQLGMGNLGLSFPGIQLPSHHQLENNRTSSTNNSHHMNQFGTTSPSSSPLLTSMQLQQQTHHQFPFMAGFHDQVPPAAAAGLYPFHQNEDVDVDGGGENHELMMMMGNCKGSTSTTSSSAGAGSTHNAPVKMEENFHKKLLLGMSAADDQNNQFWYSTENGGAVGGRTANMWTDLSGLNSSSATHLL